MLDTPIASFAYPHGSYDHTVRTAVVAAGFGSAAAIKNAVSHLDDDPFAIARWTVTAATSPEELGRILDGEGVPLAWSHVRLRTRASRTARRTRRRIRGLMQSSTSSLPASSHGEQGGRLGRETQN
jgi:hypothetical protein